MSAIQKIPERRLRLRKKVDVAAEAARMNTKTVSELQIKDRFEVVIAGKKRMELSVIPADDVPENEVYCNDATLTKQGIADNSIATIRAVRRSSS
jgi:hypothetical protein